MQFQSFGRTVKLSDFDFGFFLLFGLLFLVQVFSPDVDEIFVFIDLSVENLVVPPALVYEGEILNSGLKL